MAKPKPLQEVSSKKGEAVIYSALVSAINELQNPINRMDNPYFKSKYVPLADILETAKPVLAKHGLAVLQVPHVLYEVVQKQGNGRNGEIFHYNEEVGVVKMTTSIIHSSGAKLDFPPMIFKAGGNTPQNIGSAITYARRYSIASILGIAGKEEDDDGNHASHQYQQPQMQQGYQQQ